MSAKETKCTRKGNEIQVKEIAKGDVLSTSFPGNFFVT